MKKTSFILLLLFALSACKSVDKLYETGDYEQVISKLDGKAKRDKLDRRERSMLVKASNKYFETETQKVLSSSRSDNFKDWENAKQKLNRLQDDEDKILAYPQVRESEIDEYDFGGMIADLDQKLYDFVLNQYDIEIADYHKTGDRQYAIRAYGNVKELKKYGANQYELDSLYDYAISLGHRIIAVEFDSDVFNSWEFRNDFQREINFRDDDFNTFTERVDEETDYEIVLGAEITDKDERTNETYRNYSERVVDYYETSIDTSNNSEIKTPVYKDIEATVRTTEYLWTVEGRVEYSIYDFRNSRRFDSGYFTRAVEERVLQNILDSGDEDAVPSSIDLDNFEQRFYNYDDLIEACFEALAEEFNYKFKNKLP